MSAPTDGYVASARVHLDPVQEHCAQMRVRLASVIAGLTHPDQHALRELLREIERGVADVQDRAQRAIYCLREVGK